MGRKRKSALSEEKRNVIGQLIEMYDIKTAADVQDALKDLLGGTIQSILEAELDQQINER
ncbi:MAG: IS256 family transposase, partial [bacterium]